MSAVATNHLIRQDDNGRISIGMTVERRMGEDGRWIACVVMDGYRGPEVTDDLASAADFRAVAAYFEAVA